MRDIFWARKQQWSLVSLELDQNTHIQLTKLQCNRSAIVDRHRAVFNGVGKLKDYQLKIHIDLEVTPVAQPQHCVPFHVHKQVEAKLTELQDLDIIEDVEGPTPWVSPLVAVPKSNGDVRVCVDMRRANAAVIRERHPIPTLKETLQALNGAAVFSKLDLRWGLPPG